MSSRAAGPSRVASILPNGTCSPASRAWRKTRRPQLENCREAQAMIEAGNVPDIRTKARYRLEGAYAVDWAVRAVDVMFGLAGASGLYESGATPRAFRDAHAVKQHFSFNTDIAATTYGRVALGLPTDNPTL